MTPDRPGLNPKRVVALARAAIQRCDLDLDDANVLTEAATGAYVVTPVLAAMAGAKQVFAVTRTTSYGTVEQVTEQTLELAELAGVAGRIQVATTKAREMVAQADIVTNSAHVRPIDAQLIASMKSTAVIPLMYEAWEFRREDVDLAACRERGIPVAGTNERHPHVDVFSFLGMMAAKQLLDAGIAVYASRILLLCDNPFREFIQRGLTGAGASVVVASSAAAASHEATYDAIVVALQPRPEPVLAGADAAMIASRWPGALVAQFWGDIDRAALSRETVPVWPPREPPPGHMGVLPSEIGPEPIVRLQAGGFKVGELLWRARVARRSVQDAILGVERSRFGERIAV